jgi:putative spermidine/putrescine transport system permease protein
MLLGQQEPQMISVSIAQKFTRYNLADVPVAYALASMYTIVVVAVLFILYKKGKLIHEVE